MITPHRRQRTHTPPNRAGPEIEEKRYYSIQLQDLSTYNFGYIGSRTPGNGAGCYVVAGPKWQGPCPKAVGKVFRSDADLARAVYRPQLFNARDLDNVRTIQAGYSVHPLSDFVGAQSPRRGRHRLPDVGREGGARI